MKRKIICTAVIGIRCRKPFGDFPMRASACRQRVADAQWPGSQWCITRTARLQKVPPRSCSTPSTTILILGGLGKTATSAATVDLTTTNDSGNYTATLSHSATYNIIASGDGPLAYQDSITTLNGGTVHPSRRHPENTLGPIRWHCVTCLWNTI